MDKLYIRRFAAFFYIALVALCVLVGFQYSNDTDDYYRENFQPFNMYWMIDNQEISFPYGTSGEHFTMKNTLPSVYGDQFLVVRAYYDNFTVYIDGKEVYTSKENEFLGMTTDVGKKEFWIPLWTEDTEKEVVIDITMQRELYGASVSEAFITTRAEYAVRVLKENIPSMLVYAMFTVTGVIEIILAAIYSQKAGDYRRRRIFDALLYAGFFRWLRPSGL